MKQTDMELQAIREKLQLLQAEPPATEALALPWSSLAPSEQRARPTAQVASVSDTDAKAAGNQSPQAIAIETLKQRSRSHDQATNARIDNLISQEIYRLEVQANSINERSQQQAADIMALKRSAQQASIGLRRQGIHDHPQMNAITHFLDQYTSAVVPHIERDSHGHFTLSYDTVDFQQAQQDAIDTAHALRNRQRSPRTQPFVQPITPPLAPASETGSKRAISSAEAERNYSRFTSSDRIKTAISNTIREINQQFQTTKRKRRRRETAKEGFVLNTDSFVEEGWKEGVIASSSASEFTWLDGTIWFSSAAIVRISLQSVVAAHPAIATALMLSLVAVILFALYRVIAVKTNDYTLIYRLCIGLMGLFLAGLF